ncbi:hypothetical protein D3C86_1785670 [compost metagenome]
MLTDTVVVLLSNFSGCPAAVNCRSTTTPALPFRSVCAGSLSVAMLIVMLDCFAASGLFINTLLGKKIVPSCVFIMRPCVDAC